MINVESLDLKKIKTFPIASDLLLTSGIPKESSKKGKLQSAPLFSPKEFVKENKNIKTEQYELGHEDLMRYGKQVTLLRSGYLNQALAGIIARQ